MPEGLALGKEFFFKKIKNLCRVPAGLTLGKATVNGAGAVMVAFLCRVPRGSQCPIKGTRQRGLCRSIFCRVFFAECRTRQRLCQVQFDLCRVPQALGKEPESSSDRAIFLLMATLVSNANRKEMTKLVPSSRI